MTPRFRRALDELVRSYSERGEARLFEPDVQTSYDHEAKRISITIGGPPMGAREPGCTCNLEQDFAVTGDDTPDGIGVRDAEGELVASCKSLEHAELIAWALNLVDDAQFSACRIFLLSRPYAARED